MARRRSIPSRVSNEFIKRAPLRSGPREFRRERRWPLLVFEIPDRRTSRVACPTNSGPTRQTNVAENSTKSAGRRVGPIRLGVSYTSGGRGGGESKKMSGNGREYTSYIVRGFGRGTGNVRGKIAPATRTYVRTGTRRGGRRARGSDEEEWGRGQEQNRRAVIDGERERSKTLSHVRLASSLA